ncbi:MAG: hypothetical protein KDA90_04585 [Planctomycetaceae bacterium]|nr:hypothetical protein [Planctomycetaceae bacterium]
MIDQPAPTTSTRPVIPKTECEPSGGVSKTIINFWLDVLLMINFVVLAYVSAVLQFVFPAGFEAAGWTVWGSDVVAWQNFQFATICVFGAAITLHVMLHWNWVCGVINKQLLGRTVIKRDGTDTLIGVGVIAVILHILAIGVFMAKWAITQQP